MNVNSTKAKPLVIKPLCQMLPMRSHCGREAEYFWSDSGDHSQPGILLCGECRNMMIYRPKCLTLPLLRKTQAEWIFYYENMIQETFDRVREPAESWARLIQVIKDNEQETENNDA